MKAPMEAASPTQTVETSDLIYRMVSNTAIPADKQPVKLYVLLLGEMLP